MTETRLYIGLNDANTKKQKFSIDRYKTILKQICFNYHIAFSVSVSEGGYFHEDGEYTEENTLILTLIDTDKSVIEEIAKDLCVFFNQESVLITEDEIKSFYVQEKL